MNKRLTVLAAGLLCARASVLAAGAMPAPLPPPFGGKDATHHAALAAPYAFDDTILRLRFDVGRGIVYGHETVVVRPKSAGLRALPFDAFDLRVVSVRVDGASAAYAIDRGRERLTVRLVRQSRAGRPLAVDIAYTARPQAGMYFVRPDAGYPHIAPQIWTQGEPADNHRWFATWDRPNEKTPSELIVTVPRGWTVVANGYLKAHARGAALETWDWNAPRPKAPYLIAFLAGPLARRHTTLGEVRGESVARYQNGALDVDSFVPPADAALNAGCFGMTNRIVAFFQQLIGERFPWEKYDHMAAERFIFGGMEDTSATIVTARALHPPVEELENSCDVLVAHELGQQWFGDDASWGAFADLWLGEGFATYFDELWSRERFGEAQFEYERYRAQRAYFAETHDYLRPIVDDVYADPIQLFDASSHQRPAQVLHTLRTMVGDARFFAALRAYYAAYRGRTATTHEFFLSVGRSLGTDLSWFEREWFYRPDVPHYDVTDAYAGATHTLNLQVEQKNATPFRMPVTIEAYAGGRVYRTRALIDRARQTVSVGGLPSRPTMVLFDPNATLLRVLDYRKSPGDLAYQLAHARHVGDREWALGQLARYADAQGPGHETALRAVSDAALSDPFYGLRADAVGIAAAFGDADAVAAALHDADRRVRIAAAQSAATLAGAPPSLGRDLRAMAGDANPDAAAAALAALGARKAPEDYALLVAALARASIDDVVASGALRGLAAYGDARALPLLRARTAYGASEQERNAAIIAYAQLAHAAHAAAEALPVLVAIVGRDPLISSRMAATSALALLGDAGALPSLARVARSDSQRIVQLMADDAIADIESRIKGGH